MTCRNLFTDECIDLPDPDWIYPDAEHMIFFGHLHARGVMMLNYVTSLPASDKLRRRMKDIILRQLEFFRCQKPGATLDDFFQRDAVAVRHTLNIMANFAQLNVVPLRKAPKPCQSISISAGASRMKSASCAKSRSGLGSVPSRYS